MIKQNITVLIIVMLFISNSALANETKNNFSLKTQTPANSAKSTVVKTVNKAAMKAQITTIKSKINSTTSIHQSAVNNLAINLLPKEQLKKYNEEKENLKSDYNSASTLNIAAAQLGTARLNRFLKSYEAKISFENLTIGQKAIIKENLMNLKLASGSYTQITEQVKSLTNLIKSDKATALEFKTDVTDLTKLQYTITNQSKLVNKLIDNLINSASKAGLNL